MRARWLAVVLVVSVGLLVFPQIAFAEGPKDPVEVAADSSEGLGGPFSIAVELQLDESGAWVADVAIESPGLKPFAGLANSISGNIKLEDQSYESLTAVLALFGMDVALPKADPIQVQRAVDAGLESLAITKTHHDDGVEELRLYANDRLLLTLEAAGPVLEEALAQIGVGEMADLLLPFITEGESTIVVRFPAPKAVEVALQDELELAEGPHKNVISLGATVADNGDGTECGLCHGLLSR